MTAENQIETEPSPVAANPKDNPKPAEKILCPHCLRTATNGIKCQGICVSDNDY